MFGLHYREAYWDDRNARQAFKEFLVQIHGLDLSAWEQAGMWDDHYRPFTYFDDAGRVVSSVCVYSLEMLVRGEPCRAAQISGVGTLADRRREGLNRRLTEHALRWAAPDHRFVFLFADDEAVPFYDRCGFLPLAEQTPWVVVDPREPLRGARKIDISNPHELESLRRRATARVPASETLGVHSEKLFLFHAIYTLSDALWEIPALDCVVAARHEGARTTIYDVVAERVPSFDELYPYIACGDAREVAFYFSPDRLAVDGLRWEPLTGNNLHDRGEFPLRGERMLFPFTAHA